MVCVEKWKKVNVRPPGAGWWRGARPATRGLPTGAGGPRQHPNVVNLREAFTTKDFKDHSLVFAFDYVPKAETMFARHLAAPKGPLPEPVRATRLLVPRLTLTMTPRRSHRPARS